MQKTTSILIVTLFLALNLNSISAQAPTGREYVVQADDWLSKIAEKEYGDPLAFPAIVEATNAKAAEDSSFTPIDNPDVIEIGQKLWLPTLPEFEAPAALYLDKLKNAVYNGIYDEPVKLSDGLYEGEPFVAGGAARPTVNLVDRLVAAGDLNADDVEDAAVLLGENSGGSGFFTYLAAMVNEAGSPINAATTLLGDRVQIKSMVIDNGQILVEIVTQGPDDPLCCPTLKLRVSYQLQGDRLVELAVQEQGTISLEDLDGTSWLLVDLNFDQQPVLPGTEITLSFSQNQVSGIAGCNSYNADVSSQGDFAQSLKISSPISTKKACSDEIMRQETEYLTRLEGVTQWSYVAGHLALSYNVDNSFGTLVFKPQEAAGSTALAATEIIFYMPSEIPTETQSGSCFTNAIGLGREDAYRCMVGNAIHDPCFVVDDKPTVICGANPATGETGFVLQLTEPLPAPETGQLAMPWLVELADGQVCGLLTGTVVGVGERIASYGCPDKTYLFNDFQQGKVWMAEKALVGLNDNGFFIEHSEMVALSRLWQ